MLTVADIMTRSVYSLRETDTLLSARALMKLQRIRHIPIVGGDERFIGLLTHHDLLSATVSQLAGVDPETQDEIDAGILIKEIMRTDLKIVDSRATVRSTAEILLNHSFHSPRLRARGSIQHGRRTGPHTDWLRKAL